MTQTVTVPGLGLPGPALSDLAAPFWEACAQRRLVVPACDSCGLRFFVPEVVCPRCWSADWTWADSPGLGTLYSATTVHRAPLPDVASPYVIGVVDLDDGWTMMTHLVDVDPDDLRLGQRVAVTFRDRGGVLLPLFAPVAGDVAGDEG